MDTTMQFPRTLDDVRTCLRFLVKLRLELGRRWPPWTYMTSAVSGS